MKLDREYKIRVTRPQSVKVQKVCFSIGLKWSSVGAILHLTDKPFLFTDLSDNTITYSSSQESFDNSYREEISVEEFIKKFGSDSVPLKKLEQEVIEGKIVRLNDSETTYKENEITVCFPGGTLTRTPEKFLELAKQIKREVARHKKINF